MTGSLSGALQLEQILFPVPDDKITLLWSPLIQYLSSVVKDTNIPPTGTSSSEFSETLNKTGDFKKILQ